MITAWPLGIYLTHDYDHECRYEDLLEPYASLKGMDLSLYQIFDSLGCDISVQPILGRLLDGSGSVCFNNAQLHNNESKCNCAACTVFVGDQWQAPEVHVTERHDGPDDVAAVRYCTQT